MDRAINHQARKQRERDLKDRLQQKVLEAFKLSTSTIPIKKVRLKHFRDKTIKTSQLNNNKQISSKTNYKARNKLLKTKGSRKKI